MSEVKTYRFKGAAGEYVYSVDYDAAKSELAALRDEIGEVKGEYDRAVNKVAALREELASSKREIVTLAQLDSTTVNGFKDMPTVAEQRNAELVELLRRSVAVIGGEGWNELEADIWAAINPVESGASSVCVSDGGTCGLGGKCHQCPHKESGASE